MTQNMPLQPSSAFQGLPEGIAKIVKNFDGLSPQTRKGPHATWFRMKNWHQTCH